MTGYTVPNAPCGVERWCRQAFGEAERQAGFLMHRVELKVIRVILAGFGEKSS